MFDKVGDRTKTIVAIIGGVVAIAATVLTLVGIKGSDGQDGRPPSGAAPSTVAEKPVAAAGFPESQIITELRLPGTQEWSTRLDLKDAATEFETRLTYRNLTANKARSVSLFARIPDGFSAVAGTARLYDSEHPGGIAIDDVATRNFVVLGDYEPNATAVVQVSVRMNPESYDLCAPSPTTRMVRGVLMGGGMAPLGIEGPEAFVITPSTC